MAVGHVRASRDLQLCDADERGSFDRFYGMCTTDDNIVRQWNKISGQITPDVIQKSVHTQQSCHSCQRSSASKVSDSDV